MNDSPGSLAMDRIAEQERTRRIVSRRMRESLPAVTLGRSVRVRTNRNTVVAGSLSRVDVADVTFDDKSVRGSWRVWLVDSRGRERGPFRIVGGLRGGFREVNELPPCVVGPRDALDPEVADATYPEPELHCHRCCAPYTKTNPEIPQNNRESICTDCGETGE